MITIDKSKFSIIQNRWCLEQLEISELLYGDNLRYYFTKKDVEDIVDSILIYDQDTKDRVKEIIFKQMRRYQYLIEKNKNEYKTVRG